jgi:hypothetical protein
MACTKGYIGGFTIGNFNFYSGSARQSLYYGVDNNASTLGSGGFVLCPQGAYLSRNGTGTSSGSRWVILAGNDFGITQGGALYAASGKIGPVQFNSSGIGIGATYSGTKITSTSMNTKDITTNSIRMGGGNSMMDEAFNAAATNIKSGQAAIWMSAIGYNNNMNEYYTISINPRGIDLWFQEGSAGAMPVRRVTWNKLFTQLGTTSL